MNDYKNLLKLLFEKIERMRTETPSAGTRFRMMGLSEQVLAVELEESPAADDAINEQVRLMNEAQTH